MLEYSSVEERLKFIVERVSLLGGEVGEGLEAEKKRKHPDNHKAVILKGIHLQTAVSTHSSCRLL